MIQQEGGICVAREDPHGFVRLFSERLDENLAHMDPRAATEQALAVVKRHLDASDFLDLSSKTNRGRHYVRVDRRPGAMKPTKGGR